jgi:hypothetical protein
MLGARPWYRRLPLGNSMQGNTTGGTLLLFLVLASALLPLIVAGVRSAKRTAGIAFLNLLSIVIGLSAGLFGLTAPLAIGIAAMVTRRHDVICKRQDGREYTTQPC